MKEEHKQAEGDPAVKARLRQIRMERARKRMMAAVPSASVVITNPTHFAVALKYEHTATRARPSVVAKGADLIAQRIREIAQENDVPIVENPPLARALYASVELDQEIPPEHYKAVAEIISYVFRLKGKLRPLAESPIIAGRPYARRRACRNLARARQGKCRRDDATGDTPPRAARRRAAARRRRSPPGCAA